MAHAKSFVKDIHVVYNVVTRVYDIDTINQRFSADVQYKLRWDADEADRANWNFVQSMSSDHESKRDDEDDEFPLKTVHFLPQFRPRIEFPAAFNVEFKLKPGYTSFFKFVEGGQAYDEPQIFYDFQISCIFHEYFELEAFPFDCQDLPIVMKLHGDGHNTIEADNFRFDPGAGKKGSNKRSKFAKFQLENSALTEWTVMLILNENM